ncbi:MAG: GTP cyclohydrolase I FolE [Clostridia bacterium]|nr:GTP cyclohydrolase I FolE [Clostridia bacterium]MDE6472111.1 GTP cyclohydrolase I FolE [Clostridia bacterium]
MNEKDKAKIQQAVTMILEAIGEDPTREGLVDTPKRVANMFEELTAGYRDDEKVHLAKTFDVRCSDWVIEKNISFSSTCEHHLMPFFGKIAIAYLPSDKVVGLSKLARTVEVFARRLQLQERLTNEVADAVMDNLNAKAVIVLCEAEHTCMTARGVRKIGSKTTTFAKRGEVESNQADILIRLMTV